MYLDQYRLSILRRLVILIDRIKNKETSTFKWILPVLLAVIVFCNYQTFIPKHTYDRAIQNRFEIAVQRAQESLKP